jgi:hypothetical protein
MAMPFNETISPLAPPVCSGLRFRVWSMLKGKVKSTKMTRTSLAIFRWIKAKGSIRILMTMSGVIQAPPEVIDKKSMIPAITEIPIKPSQLTIVFKTSPSHGQK